MSATAVEPRPLARVLTRKGPPRRPLQPPADGPLCWTTVAGLGALHAGGALGVVWLIVHPSLPTMLLAASLYVACGLSVTAGYHRLFAHRTFRVAAPLRWLLLVFGAAAFQNSALSWSADHRAHHAHTDGRGDPHPVTHGAWFAHVGWLFRRRAASSDVSQLSDLWAVRSIRLQNRWYPAIAIGVGLVMPMAVAWTWADDPWGGLLVAGFLRATVMLQATLCVNSLAHLVGTPRYDQRSSARDCALTALVTFGEGYHSFHHRFPFDYRGSVRWWRYDPSKWFIWTLARIRLASHLRTASAASVARAEALAGSRAGALVDQ